MSDPDVIWSYAKFDGARIFHKKPNIPDMPTEYRRTDLPPTDAEVMAHPKVQALVDALRITRDRLNSANHDVFDGVWTERDFANETREADAALAAIQEAKP